jgi:ribulose-phosphate 3-epimerase
VHIRIHPSILSADFVNLEKELGRIRDADAVHVDVMDNHFVPSLTFGLQTVKRIADVSPVPLDVHLMIENADHNATHYADVGAHSVTFHVEAAQDPLSIIHALHAQGAQAGIAVKPNTPLEPYLELFHEADMVLIMTVEPGAGGQAFMTQMMPKVEQAARYIADHSLSTTLQVDGGITVDTLPVAHAHGAGIFVAGSSVYGHGEPSDNIHALRTCLPEGETS